MKLSKLLVVALAMVLCVMTIAQAEVAIMEGAELQRIENDNKAKDRVVVVDVRPVEQYKESHLKHAINITVDQIKENPEILADYKEVPVILYCNSGKKSGEAANILDANGYKNVSNAKGVKEFEYELYTFGNVLAKQFLEMAKAGECTIVDVRPAKDYAAGHIESAVSVPFDAVDANIDKIAKDKPVFTYCFTGNKSHEVAKKLSEMGYEVYNVLEGTKEYQYTLVK